jgi:hypothetical protein
MSVPLAIATGGIIQFLLIKINFVLSYVVPARNIKKYFVQKFMPPTYSDSVTLINDSSVFIDLCQSFYQCD